MDNLVCPRLTGIVKFTQKLMTKVHKKKNEEVKIECPICRCKSPKGNLCQACFMKSFAPIAYSRNIKVVEENEFFYGMGNNKMWDTKKEEEDQSLPLSTYNDKDRDEKGKLNYVVSATLRSTCPNSKRNVEIENYNVSGEDVKLYNRKNLSELFQPAVENLIIVQRCDVDGETKIDSLVDKINVRLDKKDDYSERKSNENIFEPQPEMLPEFCKTPLESYEYCESANRFTYLKEQLDNEEPLSFSENTKKAKTDRDFTNLGNFDSVDEGMTTGQESCLNASPESFKELLDDVQKKLWKPIQADCYETSIETEIQQLVADNPDCTSFSKQLKQRATLELLKVAFKTNMILNSLFYYFKKIVEIDGSSSESQPENNQDSGPIRADRTIDGEISVDSLFFLNKYSSIPWGNQTRANGDMLESSTSCHKNLFTTEVKNVAETTLKEQSVQSLWSDGEVVPKNMNKSYSCISLAQQCGSSSIYVKEHESRSQGVRSLRSAEEQEEEETSNLAGRKETKLYRGTVSEVHLSLPKCPRKFFSEHSSLIKNQSKDRNWYEDVSSSMSEPDSRKMVMKSMIDSDDSSQSDLNLPQLSVHSSSVGVSEGFDPPPSASDGRSQKSLLDLVFGLNRTCDKPSLLPLPDSQKDLITLSTPGISLENLTPKWKDAISQTTLSARHMEQEMNLLHKAFLDQLTHFSVQLVDSCRNFGPSWQTSFLAELVEHFRSACGIISEITGGSRSVTVPSSERLDNLQNISNKISSCLAKLRAYPHSFIGDCLDHDISTLLSSPPGQERVPLVNTWV